MVEHLVGRVQHRAEELELLAQNIEGEALRFVVLREEVYHGDGVLLAIPVAAPDTLLDALRIPRKIVVHERIAELQVQSLGAGFGGDEHPRTGRELVNEGETHRHFAARLRPVDRHLFAPIL